MCFVYIYVYGLIKQVWYTGIPIVAMYVAVCLYNQIIMLTLSIGLGIFLHRLCVTNLKGGPVLETTHCYLATYNKLSYGCMLKLMIS